MLQIATQATMQESLPFQAQISRGFVRIPRKDPTHHANPIPSGPARMDDRF